jgi:hypothetical protein
MNVELVLLAKTQGPDVHPAAEPDVRRYAWMRYLAGDHPGGIDQLNVPDAGKGLAGGPGLRSAKSTTLIPEGS